MVPFSELVLIIAVLLYMYAVTLVPVYNCWFVRRKSYRRRRIILTMEINNM